MPRLWSDAFAPREGNIERGPRLPREEAQGLTEFGGIGRSLRRTARTRHPPSGSGAPVKSRCRLHSLLLFSCRFRTAFLLGWRDGSLQPGPFETSFSLL